MKRKLVEKTEPGYPTSYGDVFTAQVTDNILIINFFHNRILQARQCFDLETGEYEQYHAGRKHWYFRKLARATGDYAVGYYGNIEFKKEIKADSRFDEDLIRSSLEGRSSYRYKRTICGVINDAEDAYNRETRDKKESRRSQRVRELMARVPEEPENLMEWIFEREANGQEYILKGREKEEWGCTACGSRFQISEIRRPDGGKKVRHNDTVLCPCCKKEVIMKKRVRAIQRDTHFLLLQPMDDEYSIARHYDACICWESGKRFVGINEAVRILLYKDSGKECRIFYNWYRRNYQGLESFDDKSNPGNRRTSKEHLYPEGIKEALEGTVYEPWSRLFEQLSAAGQQLHYNRMMACYKSQNLIDLSEMLFRGRFYRLLLQTSEKMTYWGSYFGQLRLDYGIGIEDAFGIADRQMINRIREKDGGEAMLLWMRWSERYRIRLSDKTLKWLLDNHLSETDLRWASLRMSPEQIMHYFERQRQENYKGKTIGYILAQYDDYMDMCKRLHKDTADALIFRPKNLKQRHTQAVAQIEETEARVKAEEYSKKYADAENVLGQIQEKYSYTGQDYFIKVPEKIVDIVMEGRCLHHCAGSTDRYFDRIKQRETYIVFLRKTQEPDIPFYTIEVEPGGTIRQHRGLYDEEPDIENIKPFLKEWQQEIRRRMSREDHELEKASIIKREENLEELRQKNNTRVLKGLMEDFMEAV